jgi:hypothetical protein
LDHAVDHPGRRRREGTRSREEEGRGDDEERARRIELPS